MAYDNKNYFDDPNNQVAPSANPVPIPDPNAPNITTTVPQMAQPVSVQIPTKPLSTNDFLTAGIFSKENQKNIIANEAMNLSSGALELSELNRKTYEDQVDSLNKREAFQNAAMERAKQTNDQLIADIKKAAAQNIDPNRYWNSKSTGEKILAGIGVALSGFGAGWNHQDRNPALDYITKAIDQDIAAQRGNIENSWKAIDKLHQLNNDATQRDQYYLQFMNSQRIGGLEIAKIKVAQIAEQTRSVSVKNNALLFINQLNLEQNALQNQKFVISQQAAAATASKYEGLAKERRAAENANYQELIKKGYTPEDARIEAAKQADSQFRMLRGTPWQSQGDAYEGVKLYVTKLIKQKNPNISNEDLEKEVSKQLNAGGIKDPYAGSGQKMISKEDQERIVEDPINGKTSMFPTKDSADKFRAGLKSYKDAQQAISIIRGIRAKHEGGFLELFNSSEAAELTRARSLLAGALNQMNSGGMMDKNEYERYYKLIPDASGYDWLGTGKNIDAEINNFENFLGERLDNTYKSWGGKVVSNPNIPKGSHQAPQQPSNNSDPFKLYKSNPVDLRKEKPVPGSHPTPHINYR